MPRLAVARRVEHHVGQLLVVDSLEESASARGLLVAVSMLAVVESRDASHGAAAAVVCHPADSFAVGEELVARGVEDRLYRIVERTYPAGVALVYAFGKIEKLSDKSLVLAYNLAQRVFGFVHFIPFIFSQSVIRRDVARSDRRIYQHKDIKFSRISAPLGNFSPPRTDKIAINRFRPVLLAYLYVSS